MKYLFNSSWMLLEQMLRIFSGVFVGIYIARYLGPENFGVLNYIIAISTLIIAVSRLGMDGILVRDVIQNPKDVRVYIGTAFWLMNASALACYSVLLLIVWFSDELRDLKVYISIIGLSVFFISFQVIDFYFQSQVRAKISSICKGGALLIMSIIKICLVYMQVELFWFVWAFLFDYVVLALFLFIFTEQDFNFYNCFSWPYCKGVLVRAWPLVLGAVAIQVYMRIDQLMIKNMMGAREVGIYSAAVRIYEAWAVFVVVITVSLLPAIVKIKSMGQVYYHKKIEGLLRVVVWLSIFVSVVVCMVSDSLIAIAFGGAYIESAEIVNIVIWTGIFSAIGSVSARYFIAEEMEQKFAFRTAVAALLNVILNLALIPVYGIKGAAVATLFCTFFANYLMDYFDPDLKLLLKAKNQAIFGKLLT